MKTILVPLAEGFEEIEAVTVIDILRRAGANVITAGLSGKAVTGSHGITVQCDAELSGVSLAVIDGLALPGGQPGTRNLMQSVRLRELLADLDRQNMLIGAICAAPTVLAAAGILNGRSAVCYPGCEKEMHGAKIIDAPVAEDGNIITGRSAGAAVRFALALAGGLCGKETADKICAQLLV